MPGTSSDSESDWQLHSLNGDCCLKAAFEDLQDPLFVPKQCGSIELAVSYDTQGPDILPKSPLVSIAGHVWRIVTTRHFEGSTEHLGIEVENASIASRQCEQWASDELPLPLSGTAQLPKQPFVAAQISIVAFDPKDTDVYTMKRGHYQFTDRSTKYGWPRFCTPPWHTARKRPADKSHSTQGQRRLIITAFIRIIDDPTGCLWAPDYAWDFEDDVMRTSLISIPCSESAFVAPLALLLHFRPIRQVLSKFRSALGDSTCTKDPAFKNLSLMQAILMGMQERRGASVSDDCEELYPDIGPGWDDSPDATWYLHHLIKWLTDLLTRMQEPCARRSLPSNALASGLKSPSISSLAIFPDRRTSLKLGNAVCMQQLVSSGLDDFGTPVLAVLELERQEFDRNKRCWRRFYQKIKLDDEVNINGTRYILYGFITYRERGSIENHHPYIRPAGVGGLWYTYDTNTVRCLSRRQAVDAHEGAGSTFYMQAGQSHRPDVPKPSDQDLRDEVAYVVLYAREDVAENAFDVSVDDTAHVPDWIADLTNPATLDNGRDSHMPSQAQNVAAQQPSPDTDKDVIMANTTSSAETTEPTSAHQPNLASGDNVSSVQSADAATTSLLTQVTHDYFGSHYYCGTALDNYKHGQGHDISLSGDEYVGNYEFDQHHGQGHMTFANGDIYNGNWTSDLFDGHGTFIEAATGNTYTGTWKEGKRHGVGTTYWKVSEEQRKLCRICYEVECDVAFYDCGHVCACAECAGQLDQCPVCRQKVKDVLKLYWAE